MLEALDILLTLLVCAEIVVAVVLCAFLIACFIADRRRPVRVPVSRPERPKAYASISGACGDRPDPERAVSS